MNSQTPHIEQLENVSRAAVRERAFTLIELLVVMIIIAILMAVAVPTFLSQKNNAVKTTATANIMLMKQAIESCAVGNPQGGYMGCSEHAPVWESEKSLANLPRCCGGGVKVGSYDINGIVGVNTRRNVPVADEHVSGFEIITWIRDGNSDIYFQLAHYPDGMITRKCGPGLTAPPLDKNPVGTPVSDSRTCQTGKW